MLWLCLFLNSHKAIFMNSIKKFSIELAKRIKKGKITKETLNRAKIALAEKYCLDRLPRNYEIIANLPVKLRKDKEIISVLKVKRARSSSGIVVIAVMPKPKKCPGKCIYCPTSLVKQQTPKSYTGREPATMRALSFNFSVLKQVKEPTSDLDPRGKRKIKEFRVGRP